jgi:hypothetical protein
MSNHVQLVTADRPLYLAAKVTNVTCATSVSNKYATATQPATASGSAVVGGAMNYLKITPRFQTGHGANPSMRVIGWSKCNDSNLWIPNLLCDVTFTINASDSATVNGTALLGASSMTRAQGDCKIFNSTSLNTGCFFVVDTLGYDLVELAFRSASAVQCNAHLGDI